MEAPSPPARRPTPPLVLVLATGGTIAGSAAPGLGYQAGALPVDVLLAAAPGIAGVARLETATVAAIGSQDMDERVWLRLADHLARAAGRPEVAGIVVTHGTDTMEETAWFLDLVLAPAQPVVLTGAMRPPSAPDADGPANLLAAVAVAADPGARRRGVLVVADGHIHRARDLTKTHTTDLNALTSVGAAPLGTVAGSRVAWTPPLPAAGSSLPRPPFDWTTLAAQLAGRSWPRVDVIYAHAGMDGALIAAAAAGGARGLVIAGVGSGNLSSAALAAAAAAARAGLIVVRSSRVAAGGVARNLEVDDDALGFIAAGRLNPAKARILLLLALAAPGPHDLVRLQACFDRA